jgi:hypothetical protein
MHDPEFSAYLRADPNAAYALGMGPYNAGAPRPAVPPRLAPGTAWNRFGGMGSSAAPAPPAAAPSTGSSFSSMFSGMGAGLRKRIGEMSTRLGMGGKGAAKGGGGSTGSSSTGAAAGGGFLGGMFSRTGAKPSSTSSGHQTLDDEAEANDGIVSTGMGAGGGVNQGSINSAPPGAVKPPVAATAKGSWALQQQQQQQQQVSPFEIKPSSPPASGAFAIVDSDEEEEALLPQKRV